MSILSKMKKMLTSRLHTRHTVPAKEVDRSISEHTPTLNIVFDRELGNGEFNSCQKISLAATVRASVCQIIKANSIAEKNFSGYLDHMKLWFGRPTEKNIAILKKMVIEMHAAFSDTTKYISFIKKVRESPKEFTGLSDFTDFSGHGSRIAINRTRKNKLLNARPKWMYDVVPGRHFDVNKTTCFGEDLNQDVFTVNKPESYIGNWCTYTHGRVHYSRNHTDVNGGYQIYIGENMFDPSATKEDCCQIIFHQMACELFNAEDEEHSLGIGASPYGREACMEIAVIRNRERTSEHSGCVGLFIASLGRPVDPKDLVHSVNLRNFNYDNEAVLNAGRGNKIITWSGTKSGG